MSVTEAPKRRVRRNVSRKERREAAAANKIKNESETFDASALSIVEKAFTPGQSLSEHEFEELPEIIYWSRQVFALLQGILWGIIPLQGTIGLGSSVILNSSLVFFYARFLGLDEDEWDITKLLMEGAMPAFGCFMVTWIISYTFFHT